jgi:hypothetical protein
MRNKKNKAKSEFTQLAKKFIDKDKIDSEALENILKKHQLHANEKSQQKALTMF